MLSLQETWKQLQSIQERCWWYFFFSGHMGAAHQIESNNNNNNNIASSTICRFGVFCTELNETTVDIWEGGGVYTLAPQEETSLTWSAMSEDCNNIKMSTKEVVSKTAQVRRCNKPFNSGTETSAETCKKVHVCTKHDYLFNAVSRSTTKVTKPLLVSLGRKNNSKQRKPTFRAPNVNSCLLVSFIPSKILKFGR